MNNKLFFILFMIILLVFCGLPERVLSYSGVSPANTCYVDGILKYDIEDLNIIDSDPWRADLEVFAASNGINTGSITGLELKIRNSNTYYQCTEITPGSPAILSCNSMPANSVITGVHIFYKPEANFPDNSQIEFSIHQVTSDEILLTRDAIVKYLCSLDDFIINEDGVLISYKGNEKNVTIPHGVTAIGNSAFGNCSVLQSVVVPESVFEIGNYAFANCRNLSNITIPNSVYEIGEGAFYNCSSLTYIKIPDSIDEIKNYVFYRCSSLNSISIPDGVRAIGNRAFEGCSMMNITLPEGLITIGSQAFKECQHLTRIKIPDGVISIGYSAFSFCRNLSSIHIPRSLTRIEQHTFYDCSKLTNISIHDGITAIGMNSFEGCSSLTSIAIPYSVFSIGSDAFEQTVIIYADPNSYAWNWAVNNSYTVKSYSGETPSKKRIPGKNIYWSIDGNTLTISGTGTIDFGNSNLPWDPTYYSNITKIIIQEGITRIGNCWFYGFTDVRTISIPNSVASIGNYAFYNCSSLTNLTIPNSVTSIGPFAFYKCSNLTNITIPNSLPVISNGVFSGCESLANLTLPDSVTSIGSEAFSGCSSLTSLTLPDSVTSIGTFAFYDCSNLSNITIPNSLLVISNGLFCECSNLVNITIPDSVKSIGNQAFFDCNSLTNLIIPNSVTSIGWQSFGNCSSLTNIKIPNSVIEIGSYAFIGCSSLTNLMIPNSVTSIGNYAFKNCVNLTSVIFPDSIPNVGIGIFDGCTSLTNDIIPETNFYWDVNGNTLTIGGTGTVDFSRNDAPWYEYKNLITNIIIENGITRIGNYWFFQLENFTTITIPNTVTEIGNYAFYGCSNLINLTIPNSVIKIGEYAFTRCSSLINISISDGLTRIGDYAFYGCSSLSTIKIPNSVTAIGGNAFYECHNLENVTISNKVTEISRSMFYRCSSLTNITIPDSVTAIGDYAFYGCSSLAAIRIPNSVTVIGRNAFYECSNLENITIPNKVTEISISMFYGCRSLANITIPNSVTSIGSYAFQNCSSLTNITIPNSVTSIGSYAFQNCSSLTNLTIPNSVTSIGSYAFQNCSSLTNLTISNGVTVIGSFAFSECSSLTNLTIPDSVTTIGWQAFRNCSSLSSITIPNGVTEIGYALFSGCSGLKSVMIPNSVISIGEQAFYGCSNLTNITIPNSVTEIRNYAFLKCSHLTSITIPNGVTLIGSNAFQECSSLNRVTISNSVRRIGNNAFTGCSSLREIMIPDSVIAIGDYAFQNCPSLSNVVLSEGLSAIGNQAFRYCNSLESIKIPRSIKLLGDYAFSNTTKLLVYFGSYGEEWAKDNNYLYSYELLSELSILMDDGSGTLIEVTGQMVTLDVIGNRKIQFRTQHIDGNDPVVTWKSSAPNIADVDQYGYVTVQKMGTTIITAVINGTSTKESVTVNVSAMVQPYSIIVEGPDEVALGKTARMSISFAQDPQPINKAVNWESLIPEIVLVNDNGVVTGISEGVGIIQACSKENEAFCAEKEVTVLPYSGPDAKEFSIWWLDEMGEYVNDNTVTLDMVTEQPLTLYVYDAEGEVTDVSWKNSTPRVASFENDILTGLSTGITKLTASHIEGSKTVSASVTVKVLAKVQPGSLVITGPEELAERKMLRLTAAFDQVVQPTNTKIIWISSDERIAKVSNTGVVTGVSMGDAVITACSAENPDICADHPVHVTPVAAAVDIIDPDDSNYAINLAGSKRTIQLEARITPEQASQAVTWKSSSPAIADVDEYGLVTAKRAGTVTITAKTTDGSNKSGTVKISIGVMPRAGSLVVSGGDEVAERKSLKLTASFDQEVQPTNPKVTWSSSNEYIARVSAAGMVTGVSGGTAVITVCSAADSRICVQHPVTVLPMVQTVIIVDTENNGLGIDLGTGKTTYQLGAYTEPADASQAVTWKSSSPAIADVDEYGLVTAKRAGTVTITAKTMDGSNKSGAVKISIGVMPRAGSLVVSGGSEVAERKSLKLTAYFDQEVQPTNPKVTWSSSNDYIARVSAAGMVTGVSGGTAVITVCSAADNRICAQHPVTVLPMVQTVIIVDTENNGLGIDLGTGKTSYQLGAYTEPADASQAVTWKSSSPAIADVDENGLVTARRAGTVTITARALDGSNKSGTIRLSIGVMPRAGSLVVSGGDEVAERKSLKLTAYFNQEVQPTNPKVTWSSSNEYIARVSAAGMVTGVSGGTAVITVCSAADSRVCAQHPVTVLPMVQTVIIVDTENNGLGIDLGTGKTTYQLGAYTEPADASQAVTWKSSSPAIADVDDNGLVTAKKAGSVTITARALDGSNKSGTIRLSIGVMPRAGSLVVSGGDEVAERKSLKLTAYFNQEVQPTNPKVTWSSSDTGIARVSAAGMVTGAGGGTAVITACSAADSRICAEHMVRVLPIVRTVTITDEDNKDLVIDLAAEQTSYQLGAFAEPADASQSVTWKSSSASIAEVDENGLVTAMKAGTVTITARAMDGSNVSASVRLTIKAKVQPGSLKISGDRIVNIKPRERLTLTAAFDQAVQPTIDKIVWTGSDDSVARVTSAGVLTGVNEGTAVIRAEAKDDASVYDEITVNVTLTVSDSAALDKGNALNQDELGLTASGSSAEQTGDLNGSDGITGSGEETSVPHFTVKEAWLQVGDSLIVDVVDPDDGMMVGLGGDTDAVLWNEEMRMITSVGEAEVTAFLADVNTVEIKDMMTIHIVNEIPEIEEVSEEDGEAEEQIAEEPAADEELSELTAPSETEENPEAPVTEEAAEETAGPHFREKEVWLQVGDSLILDVVNPDGEAVMIGFGGDADAVLWNEELRMLTSDAEAEVTAFLADAETVEIKDMMTIHIVNEIPEIEEISEDVGEAEEQIAEEPAADEELSELTAPSETEENPEAPVTEKAAEETAGLHFGAKEVWLQVGDSLILDVVNPEGEAVMIGLSGDKDAVLWNEEQHILTSIGVAEVTAFLTAVDTVEIKDMMAIHIVSSLPETEEVPEDDSDSGITETEEPAAGEDTAELTEPASEEEENSEVAEPAAGDDSAELTEPVAEEEENPEAVEPAETEEDSSENAGMAEEENSSDTEEPGPAENDETESPASEESEETIEIRIRDLDEYEPLNGEAFGLIVIDRERFELDDEVLRGLVFEVENESVAKVTERSFEEMLIKGLEIQLLAEGETKLLIKQYGEEEVLREIRLVVAAAPVVEPVQPTEEEQAEEVVPSYEETAEPEAVSEAADEPAGEQVTEDSSEDIPEETSEETSAEIVPEEAYSEPEPESEPDVEAGPAADEGSAEESEPVTGE